MKDVDVVVTKALDGAPASQLYERYRPLPEHVVDAVLTDIGVDESRTWRRMMERVRGIGGVFFKARDPKALAEWYGKYLGIPVAAGQTYAAFESSGPGEQTTWSAFPTDTKYFGPGSSGVMVNYRVDNLDAMLAQLRKAGVEMVDRIDEYDFGRFGWAVDPEGNRFELWEPKASG